MPKQVCQSSLRVSKSEHPLPLTCSTQLEETMPAEFEARTKYWPKSLSAAFSMNNACLPSLWDSDMRLSLRSSCPFLNLKHRANSHFTHSQHSTKKKTQVNMCVQLGDDVRKVVMLKLESVPSSTSPQNFFI